MANNFSTIVRYSIATFKSVWVPYQYNFAVFLAIINCVNVTWAARLQNVFLVAKVLALLAITVTGFVWLGKGLYTDYF